MKTTHKLITLIAVLAACSALAAPVFAQPAPHMGRGRGHADDRVAQTANRLIRNYSDTAVGDLTVGEIARIAAVLSVPAQEAAYIRRVSIASRIVPGAGQFMNGDAGAGALFLAGDIALFAGSLVALNYTLPESLRYGQLDYFNTPVSDIKAAWETATQNITFSQLLPVIGVSAGSALLRSALGMWSSSLARQSAVRMIEIGEIEFEARPMFLFGRRGFPGMGLMMSY